MNTAQKIHASTQKFIEIQDIKEDIVLLSGGSACLIVEVQATNFSLLSPEEQHAKIAAYASLLNSLSFPIQIVVHSKQVDISSYLKLLDSQMQKMTILQHAGDEKEKGRQEKRMTYVKQYRAFVEELIKVNTVLDKTFYIVISFSFLEKGVTGVTLKKEEFFAQAKAGLHTKAESLLSQFGRLSLKSRVLEKESLIRVFYDIFNPGPTTNNMFEDIGAPVVKGTQ